MTAPTRPRPNVLFWLFGLILILVGVATTVVGLIYAVAGMPNDIGDLQGARRDMEPLVNGGAAAMAGLTVMTIGRYWWRGARRRGWRDRLGRLLITIGYLIIGTALVVLTRFVLEAFGSSGDSSGTILTGLVVTTVLAIVGTTFVIPGLRMTKEQVLMTASASGSF
jgi:hypothetical protein